MNPIVQNIETFDDETTFDITNCNVSIVNGLRRTIISQIPTVVFRTAPYEKSLVQIHKNTCRLNNEIIKQRISCIPIYISDPDVDIDNFIVELDVSNDTDSIKFVTTQNFKIKNIKTDKYLDREVVKTIFPKNSLTNEYILITRLRPALSDDSKGEEISLSARFTISNAEESSCFNVSSNCTYMMTPDPVKQRSAWDIKEKHLKSIGINDEDIIGEKENWYNNEAKRFYNDNAFKFKLETIGVFTNSELILKGCEIMQDKVRTIIDVIDDRSISIEKSKTAMSSFDVKLENEDYSVGKALEYAIYSKFYDSEPVFDFVSFHKFHPHDKFSIIRISFKDNTEDKEMVYGYIKQGCVDVIEAYEKIKKNFN